MEVKTKVLRIILASRKNSNNVDFDENSSFCYLENTISPIVDFMQTKFVIRILCKDYSQAFSQLILYVYFLQTSRVKRIIVECQRFLKEQQREILILIYIPQIPKPGKDRTEVESYRFISLFSTLTKLFEKLLIDILSDTNNLI